MHIWYNILILYRNKMILKNKLQKTSFKITLKEN